jgi:hypothetical protein
MLLSKYPLGKNYIKIITKFVKILEKNSYGILLKPYSIFLSKDMTVMLFTTNYKDFLNTNFAIIPNTIKDSFRGPVIMAINKITERNIMFLLIPEKNEIIILNSDQRTNLNYSDLYKLMSLINNECKK